jgi:hypothetical protein
MSFFHLLLKKTYIKNIYIKEKKREKKKKKKEKKKKKKTKRQKKKKKKKKRKKTEFSCENPGNWHNINSNSDWKTK